jgi:hypothetical protein
MNAERLLTHYERIVDAPEAIAHLRRFILDLAIRGKLMPQDPNDEPASELLKRIATEKAYLVKMGKAKRQEPLAEPDLEQVPFDLPIGWMWARFPELGIFGRGKSKHRPGNDPALFENGAHLMIQTGDVARSQGMIKTYTNKYNDFGLAHGWNQAAAKIEDEPGTGLEEVLSIRVFIDESLEARWSIHNDRIDETEKDPPTVRYKDAKRFATNRLGAYAERHLGWGRASVLTRIGENAVGYNLQLAEAGRAARTAFRAGDQSVFKKAVDRAEELSKLFAVPVRGKFGAELDVQSVSITAGGISLHDENLPLRRLGTGSSRLLVAALQHDAGPPHIAIIDEIEHGLEPHRVARLIKYLFGGPDRGRKQIDLICRAMVKEAKRGNVFAFKAIADRVEGAVKQDVDLNVSGESVTKQLSIHMSVGDLSDLYAQTLRYPENTVIDVEPVRPIEVHPALEPERQAQAIRKAVNGGGSAPTPRPKIERIRRAPKR